MCTARILAVAGCLLILAAPVQSSSLSRAANPVIVGSSQLSTEGDACGGEFLTQSSTQSIVADNSVSCNVDGSVHVENSYYRVYDLTNYPIGFNLCGVEIGVQSAAAPSGSQPLTLNLYGHTGAPFPGGAAFLIGSTPLTVTDQTGTLLTVPVSTFVPAGVDLLIEVLAPDGQAQGNSFFIGSNAAIQTAPSFLRAPNCGIAQPASTASSGFPDMHIVLNARGDAAIGLPQVSANPALAEFGSVEIGASVTRSVRLSNSGSAELIISSIATPPQPFDIVTDGCSGRTLQPGMSCDIGFAFSPLFGESVSTTLAVISNAASSSIDLHGTGLLPIPLPGPGPLWLWAMVLALLILADRRLRARSLGCTRTVR